MSPWSWGWSSEGCWGEGELVTILLHIETVSIYSIFTVFENSVCQWPMFNLHKATFGKILYKSTTASSGFNTAYLKQCRTSEYALLKLACWFIKCDWMISTVRTEPSIAGCFPFLSICIKQIQTKRLSELRNHLRTSLLFHGQESHGRATSLYHYMFAYFHSATKTKLRTSSSTMFVYKLCS